MNRTIIYININLFIAFQAINYIRFSVSGYFVDSIAVAIYWTIYLGITISAHVDVALKRYLQHECCFLIDTDQISID